VKSCLLKRGMLRAGGWGYGFIKVNHAVLNEGGAGTQSLARSVSGVMKFIKSNQ